MAFDQRPVQNPLSHNCSIPKTIMEQTKSCTQSSDDDLSLSPTLITRQCKKTSKSVDNPLLHTISTIGDDDSDEAEIVPYPDSQALIERFWDLKLNQRKESDDNVEYVGSNSIDSGYKSTCETPESQYHSLDHQPNQRLAKRGSVSSLSSTGSSGSLSSGVSSVQTTFSCRNSLKTKMNSLERLNRRPPLPPSRRITKTEKTEDIKSNEQECIERLQGKPSIENILESKTQDLENKFEYHAKSRTYTTSYASKCTISPLSSDRRPRSSSPVSRSTSIKRKRHHSGDLTEVDNKEIFDSEKVEEYLLPDHCLFTNWLQHTTSGLDPPPQPKHPTLTKIKTTAKTKSEVKQQALNILELEIDSLLYGFHPSKALISNSNAEKSDSKVPSLIPPPRPPKTVPSEPPEEETAVYSPAVTQCVLDALIGIQARKNSNNGKGSSLETQTGESEVKRVQGPSSFLKEYIQSQMLKHQPVDGSDSDCSLDESHLYEEIIYGTGLANTKPNSPLPTPPPLPARPAHIFKKYISMGTKWTEPFLSTQSQRRSLNSQIAEGKLFPKKSAVTTKATEHTSQTSQISSQNQRLAHPIPNQNINTNQSSQNNNNNTSSSNTKVNKQTIAQIPVSDNKGLIIGRSQASNHMSIPNKPTPPPKPVKPPRTSISNSPQLPLTKTLQSYLPNSNEIKKDGNQPRLIFINTEQEKNKRVAVPNATKNVYNVNPPENNNGNKSNKPNQRSNLYSIFKDRDHRRCLSASLHQEFNEQDQEHNKDIFTADVKNNTNLIEQLKNKMRHPVVSSDDDYGFNIVPHFV